MHTPSQAPARRDSERGQILIMVALGMVLLLGMAAFSIDASFMYDKRQRLYAAADAAAKSAALEVARDSSLSNAVLVNFARQQVTAHGFTGSTAVVVNRPPASGAYTASNAYVEVIVSEPTSTFFGRVLGIDTLTPTARAVAGADDPANCFTALGPTSPALSIGNSTLTLTGCGVAVGGNLSGTNPNATITGTPAPPVTISGACSGTCGNMGSLATGAPAPVDPLAGLALPSNPGGCRAGTAATLSEGCYTSISTNVRMLQAGVYYVTGTVNIAATLTGSNVLIYLTGSGRLSAAHNRALTLTARTTGPYTGIAIFQDPANTNAFTTGNHFALSVSGAVYMPSSDVTFGNHLSIAQTTCTVVVARSMVIPNGNGQLTNSGCAATYGGAAYLSVSMAE